MTKCTQESFDIPDVKGDFEELTNKLHVGLNHSGYFPEFVTITEDKISDVEIGCTLKSPQGSIVAVDRGYNDYAWYNRLTENKTFFVTRLKSNTKLKVVSRKPVLKNKELSSDQVIKFTSLKLAKECPIQLACIKFQPKMKKSMQQILRLLQLNLFEKRDLMALLRGVPFIDKNANNYQMSFV